MYRKGKTKLNLIIAEKSKGVVMSSTSNLAPSTEPEEGGFNNLEMTRQSTHSRRHKFAGIRPNGAANNIYARCENYSYIYDFATNFYQLNI